MNNSLIKVDQIVSRNNLRSFFIVGLSFALLTLGACKPVQQQIDPIKVAAQCGECLEMPTGEVCTPTGVKRNSCMAICEGVKILCFEACPCPDET